MSDNPPGIDENAKNADASRGRARARVDEEVESAALALEGDSQIKDTATVRDIILSHPRVRVLVVASAIRCLGAEKFFFSKSKGEFVAEPDYSTQMKAVSWLAAYSDGLPVQTNLNINTDAGKKSLPMEEMLAASPAALAAVERTIAAARARVQKGGAKQALPVESETGTPG